MEAVSALDDSFPEAGRVCRRLRRQWRRRWDWQTTNVAKTWREVEDLGVGEEGVVTVDSDQMIPL